MKKSHMFSRTLILIFLYTCFGHAQKKVIEIIDLQDDIGILLMAVNNSNVQQEVTLSLTIDNLRGYEGPITKLLPANSTTEMIKLQFIKNKKWTYKSNYSYKPSIDKSENEIHQKKMEDKEKVTAYDRKIKQLTTNEIGDYSKGIVLFSQEGCPRSKSAIIHMLDKNIDFRIVNTTKDEKQKNLMWGILKEETPPVQKFTFPVIIVNGKVSYSISDLKEFVDSIKN